MGVQGPPTFSEQKAYQMEALMEVMAEKVAM
jgi:hypothetical protein